MLKRLKMVRWHAIAVGGALAAVAAVCFVFLSLVSSGGSAEANAPSPNALYAVLNSSAPSGLPLVAPPTGPANAITAAPSGPTFRATPPARSSSASLCMVSPNATSWTLEMSPHSSASPSECSR